MLDVVTDALEELSVLASRHAQRLEPLLTFQQVHVLFHMQQLHEALVERRPAARRPCQAAPQGR